MEFKKYNSIENAYQKEILEQLIFHGFEKEIYVVQEKVHGANFAFYTDGQEIKMAKRTDFLLDDETFYNAQKVKAVYADKVLKLFEIVKTNYPDIEHITIIGELFGGAFKHPDVARDPDALRVQKGVQYAPHNDFYAFDIKLNGRVYLSVDEANDLFEASGFFYAKSHFEGSLKEALDYPNAFNSNIPKWLGLPDLEENVCEGTIIKPKTVKFFGNGSRVILKNKNDKWSEVEKRDKPRIQHKETSLSEPGQLFYNTLMRYVTANRLNNVLSKEGGFSPKIMGKVIGLMAQDTLADFLKDNGSILDNLEKSEQKIITKRLQNAVIALIKAECMTLK